MSFVVLLLAASHLRAVDEVRALWVVRTTLTSPSAVETMVSAARSSGFNTLLVQIRGRGDAYYANALEPRGPGLSPKTEFDPLATTLALAHAAGLRVHAWINVNLVAGAGELPPARDHVIYRHPEWLMVPRALAADLRSLDPRSPGYVGRLARYVRSQPAEIEGLYLSPAVDAAAEYTVNVARDIVSRYDVDGVHFDYVRYPTDDFDYSREALDAFRRTLAATMPSNELRQFDRRAAADPLIYTDTFPDRWRAFRMSRLDTLVERLHDVVKGVRPGTLVSAAVIPDGAEASARHLQDWRGWIARGLLDVVCPMAYTTDADVFAAQIARVRDAAGARPMWAGIGAYRLSSTQIVENVQTARRLGADGVILFSYDSLTGPPHGTEYLAQVARAAFMFP